jgi:hypothetical protein
MSKGFEDFNSILFCGLRLRKKIDEESKQMDKVRNGFLPSKDLYQTRRLDDAEVCVGEYPTPNTETKDLGGILRQWSIGVLLEGTWI